MTEEKTVKHHKRLPLRERAEILRLADEKGPEVIVRSQKSYFACEIILCLQKLTHSQIAEKFEITQSAVTKTIRKTVCDRAVCS